MMEIAFDHVEVCKVFENARILFPIPPLWIMGILFYINISLEFGAIAIIQPVDGKAHSRTGLLLSHISTAWDRPQEPWLLRKQFSSSHAPLCSLFILDHNANLLCSTPSNDR
jgi:hypothetical protein